MGARAPSFTLELPPSSAVAANAAIAYRWHGPWQLRVLAGGHALPTTITAHHEYFAHPAADRHGSLRPTRGDWPIGTLDVLARNGYSGDEQRATVTIGPARHERPRCTAVGTLVRRRALPLAMLAGRDYVAIDHGAVESSQGPFVVAIVEHESGRWRRRRGTQQTLVVVGRPGAIALPPPLPDRLVRLRFVDLAGGTLELLPPFPIGPPFPRQPLEG